MNLRLASLALVVVLLGGCGYASVDGEGVELAVDGEGLASGIAIKGPLACMQTVSGTVTGNSTFDGYTFDSKGAQSINLKTQSNKRSRLMVYGPQKANGSWGNAFFKVWVDYSAAHGTYTVSLPVALPATGKYLVTLGSYTPGKLSYDLNLGCQEPYCVEFVAADETGTSLRNFYAFDVASYDAGKQLLAQQNGNLIEEAINPGTCAQQSIACPFYFRYAPVCGDLATDSAEWLTFDSECAFKAAVRQGASGSEWNGSKGHWDDGACQLNYCVAWRVLESGILLNQYYAYNVTSYQAGKDLLAAFGEGTFAEETIMEGTCASQQPSCAMVYAPVCGDLTVDEEPAATYGDGCAFRSAVILAAGEGGKAHGTFEKGECAPYCPADEMPYVTHTPEICRVIKFNCAPGTVPFSNECGCGCKPAPLRWFVSCGTPVCYLDQAAPASVPTCTESELLGNACGEEGLRCVPPEDLGCGKTFLCAAQEPTVCPK
ncbi:MAG TPA: hypothetical protein VGK67_00730 [Myxococcales bacterium]|jgi:hypothetical protein